MDGKRISELQRLAALGNDALFETAQGGQSYAVTTAEIVGGAGRLRYDVTAYGAKGDGLANDYPAINAALAALIADGGGTLWFPGDHVYRITTGAAAIHLYQVSDVAIEMGDRATLLMDNLVGGNAVSHGIYIQGPCDRIALRGVHVKYVTLSVDRQTWAPFYFLGANVGTGDQGTGGWYRGEPGGERVDLMHAGAIRDVILENCKSENSPSVGFGLVLIDRLVGSNLTVLNCHADGVYLRVHRLVQIDGYYGWHVGDDGISMGSEESSLSLSDIENDFHGEGSTFSNIVLDSRPPNPPPAGSLALLGVRDTTITGFVCIDRFRGLRIESGTQKTLDYPLLNLNFLANRRVVVSDVALSGCVQDLAIVPKECNAGTPDKWWRHQVLFSNIAGMNGGSALDCYGPGIPQNGGPPLPIYAGITFRNMKFSNYANSAQTWIGMIDCCFDGLEIDSTIAIQGFVPYGVDTDLLGPDGKPMFPENRTVFRNLKVVGMTWQGLKRCWIDNVESVDAARDALVFLTCADLDIGTLRVIRPDRLNDPLANSGAVFDEFCKRISVHKVDVETDANYVHAAGFRNANRNWIDTVRVKTTDAPTIPYITTVSDQSWIETGVSQVGKVEWLHTGNTARWNTRQFCPAPTPEVHGDASVGVYAEGQSATHRLIFPLAADRIWTLYDARSAVGDVLEIVREASATGPFKISFEGQAPEVAAQPQGDAYTSMTVAGGPGGRVTSLLLNLTTQLLNSSVNWTTTDENTALLIAASINAAPAAFRAEVSGKLVFIRAPLGTGPLYNAAKIEQTVSGDMLLAYGVIPRMIGGNDASSAGEVAAVSTFLIIGDNPAGMTGSVATITVDTGAGGIKSLLAAPVPFTWESNRTAFLVAEACMANYAAHGFTVAASRNGVLIKAPPGNGSSANGWPVVVTPTGQVTTYNVQPMAGGRTLTPASPAPPPYPIISTIPGAAFSARFGYTLTGWKLMSLTYDRLYYANGVPLLDGTNRLYDSFGTVVADEFKNRMYATGAVMGYDSGMLAMGLSAPPSTATSFGNPGMVTYAAGFLYVCVAANTWVRAPLATW